MPIVGTLFVVLFAQSYNISATLPPLLLRLFAQNRQIAREKKKNLCLPTHKGNGKRYRNRKRRLSESEMMAILIMISRNSSYHSSGVMLAEWAMSFLNNASSFNTSSHPMQIICRRARVSATLSLRSMMRPLSSKLFAVKKSSW